MSYKKKSIAILGSTGSIGKISLKVIEENPKLFKLDLLACNSNKVVLYNQIKKFFPKYVIINNLKIYNFFKKIKFKKKIKFYNGIKSFNNDYQIKFDKVILGISSHHGLEYAFSFINYSKKLLIANKETIVCGGNYFLMKAKKKNCLIESIDSEHFCLASTLKKFHKSQISKIYLTASGGPFLKKNTKEIKKIKPNHALKHPIWKMGKKISIDSATMANKGLEVIEASILFKMKPDNIKIKIHEESKVHSAVLLNNGLIHLVAHNSSMRIPIENSLLNNYQSFPMNQNFFLNKKKFIFSFDEIKLKKFKMIDLAYMALNYGPRACIIYNVVNDILVDRYLDKKIFFYEIYHKLNKVMKNKNIKKFFKKKISSKKQIYETIDYANKLII